jgi:hypothetical protein
MTTTFEKAKLIADVLGKKLESKYSNYLRNFIVEYEEEALAILD